MKRRISSNLEKWLNSKSRRPLILRGARQVGKSTLVRMFAQEQGLQLLEINLERYTRLDQVFATLDIKMILRELEGVIGQKIAINKTILFLDEIQATPHALKAAFPLAANC